MSKKIAIIGTRGYPSSFPGSSGIDTFIEQIVPFLDKSKITIYTRIWVKNTNKNKLIKPVFCLKNKYLDTGLYTIFSTLIALKDKNDIYWYQAPGSCLLIYLCKILNKKTILTVHGLDWQRKKWKNPLEKYFLKSLESMAIKNSSYCTGVSQEICDYIQSRYNKPCLLTPPHPISLTQKKPLNIKKYKLEKDKYFLFLGRIVPEKNIEWLIQSFKKLKNIKYNYKLVIAGNIESNKYCKKLLSLSSKNIIFTNYVSGDIKNELLSNCSVYIQASELEGNPISIYEALSFNKKCLVSNINIHQEISKKYKNVSLFIKDDYKDFNNKLISLLKEPLLKQKFQNNWSNTANIFLNLFNK